MIRAHTAQQWHINFSWKTKMRSAIPDHIRPQCVGRSYSVTDWANDGKWSTPAALTLWCNERPRRRKGSLRHLFKVYFRFGGAWVLLLLECYYLIWSLTCCIINKHLSSVSRHRNVLYSLHLPTMHSSHKHCFFTIPDVLFKMKNDSLFGLGMVIYKCL